MIRYRIVHHSPGRIRLNVPDIRRVPLQRLRQLATLPIPAGIKEVRPNPLTGSIVITYAPEEINILSFIEETLSGPEVREILGGLCADG